MDSSSFPSSPALNRCLYPQRHAKEPGLWWGRTETTIAGAVENWDPLLAAGGLRSGVERRLRLVDALEELIANREAIRDLRFEHSISFSTLVSLSVTIDIDMARMPRDGFSDPEEADLVFQVVQPKEKEKPKEKKKQKAEDAMELDQEQEGKTPKRRDPRFECFHRKTRRQALFLRRDRWRDQQTGDIFEDYLLFFGPDVMPFNLRATFGSSGLRCCGLPHPWRVEPATGLWSMLESVSSVCAAADSYDAAMRARQQAIERFGLAHNGDVRPAWVVELPRYWTEAPTDTA
jgi:hypothetical protein